MNNNDFDTKDKRHDHLLKRINARIWQPGIEFPKPGQQEHLLIIRLNIVDKESARLRFDPPNPRIDTTEVRQQKLRKSVHDGLINLLKFLDLLHTGDKKID